MKTSLEISEMVRHIYAMGMPISETFSLIMMMNAMVDKLPYVQDQIADAIMHSTPSDPYTLIMVHACLEMVLWLNMPNIVPMDLVAFLFFSFLSCQINL